MIALSRHIILFLFVVSISAKLFSQSWEDYTLPDSVPNFNHFTSPSDQVTDFQTVGSLAPYYIYPDSSIRELIGKYTDQKPFLNSLFQWGIWSSATNIFESNIGEIRTFKNQSIIPLSKNKKPHISGPRFFKENLIGIQWNDTGMCFVGAAEQMLPIVGDIPLPTAVNYDFNPVYVLPLPRYSFPDTNTFTLCMPMVDTDTVIPVNLFGIGDFEVEYTIEFFPNKMIGGTRSDSIQHKRKLTNPVTFDENWNYTTSVSQYQTPKYFRNNQGLPLQIKALQWGRYEITIQNVTDQVSRKSLNPIRGIKLPKNGSKETLVKFFVYIKSTPTNPQIQQLRNLK